MEKISRLFCEGKIKEGYNTIEFSIPEPDKKAVLQILKKLGLKSGKDYDIGVGKGASFIIDLDMDHEKKVMALFQSFKFK